MRTVSFVFLSGVTTGFGIILSFLGAPAELTILSFAAAAITFGIACYLAA